MVLLLGRGGGAGEAVREEDVETDVELSSNESMIVSQGSTLLSIPLTARFTIN